MLAPAHTQSIRSPHLSRGLHMALLAAWIGAVLAGMSLLGKYERTPEPVTQGLSQWPASSSLSAPSGGFTLVMAVHPCCPCTRASVDALARIMEGKPHPAAVYVLFYTPKVLPPGWKKTDLYDRVAAIPGVVLIEDSDGQEAARFQATVSGQTLLFDATKRRQYNGGLTAARGVEGDSLGQEAIRTLLRGQQTTRTPIPVFGCSLLSSR